MSPKASARGRRGAACGAVIWPIAPLIEPIASLSGLAWRPRNGLARGACGVTAGLIGVGWSRPAARRAA